MPDLEPPSRWIRWVPNALSIGRLGLAGAFPAAPPAWWPWMIAIAGFTDLADGFIARRFNASSWVGGLLDGIADKAFVLSAVLSLAFHGVLEIWQAPILLCRDLVVGALAGYASWIRNWEAFRRMPARPLGKITTAALFALLVVLALPTLPAALGQTLFALTAASSVAAATDYFVQFLRAKKLSAAGGWSE